MQIRSRKNQVLTLRRLQAIDNIKRDVLYKNNSYNLSLIHRYLRTYLKLFGDENVGLDVEALGYAIDTYYRQGQTKAFEYIDYFKNFDDDSRLIFKSIASGFSFIPAENKLSNLNELDASVFVDASLDAQTEREQNCYNNRMESLLGYGVPFDRNSMSSLFSILIPHMAQDVPSNLEDLKNYLFEFVSVLWPIYTPKVLRLAYDYLDCHIEVSLDKIRSDYAFFKRLGFQKILSRLIVLRAVNNQSNDLVFLSESDVWSDTEFTENQTDEIKAYLLEQKIASISIEQIEKQPPIERAISLSLYVYSSKHHYQMMERVLEAFEVDSEAVMSLDWSVVYNEFQKIEHINKPSLVALGAILTNDRIRSKFRFVKNQYGLGGAASDLTSYCEYCLLEKRTLFQFLSSFSSLGTNTFKVAMDFILSSVDEISNLYSTDRAFLKKTNTRQNSVLLVKRDCIIFAERKNALEFWEAEETLAEIRRNFRQRKYEQVDGEGKIIIDETSLALQIYRWLGQHEERLTPLFVLQDLNLKSLRLGALTLLLAPELGRFICFSDGAGVSNKLAFDIHLGNKLRHNILSMRFEDNVQSALPEELKETLFYAQLKIKIDEVIDRFGGKWVSIDDSRSFLRNLNKDISNIFMKWDHSNHETLMPLAKEISKMALVSFSKLLSDCRTAWTSEYQNLMIDGISQYLDNSDGVNQRVSDQIIDAIQLSFTETLGWININQSKYADNIDLADLINTEVTQIKRQQIFRRQFRLDTFLSESAYKKKQISNQSLKVAGDLVDPVVILVDNLIFNACKYSGLGVNTPFKFDIIKKRGGIEIVGINEYKRGDYTTIASKLNTLRDELSKPLDLQKLREKTGTGFARIRFAFANAVGEDFSISIPNFSKMEPVKIVCFIPITAAESNEGS